LASLFGRERGSKPDGEGRNRGDDLWLRCEFCNEIVYRIEVERKLSVCPKCNYHFNIPAHQRIALVTDE